jgi:hypothetical protein
LEERKLENQLVEGEIALVIDYQPGRSVAIDVLQGAMQLIEAMDRLDSVLLSSVDTSLEPVSILNDVQHSSLKMLLARALRGLPDEHLGGLDWKKWVGSLLVKGKHSLLQHMEADAPEIRGVLVDLEAEYSSPPQGLIGYTPPAVTDVQSALSLPEVAISNTLELGADPLTTMTNRGVEFFKIKSVDMLGKSQWTVLRNQRLTKVDMLHESWLDRYHKREFVLLPGDSLECHFEETIYYDAAHNEVDRKLAIVEIIRIIPPPVQGSLHLT